MLTELGYKNQCGNAYPPQRLLEPIARRGKLGEVQLKTHTPLTMMRPDLEIIPDFEIPAGYTIKWYRPGDEQHWLRVHLLADRENLFKPDTFAQQFGSDARILAQDNAICSTPPRALSAPPRHGSMKILKARKLAGCIGWPSCQSTRVAVSRGLL